MLTNQRVGSLALIALTLWLSGAGCALCWTTGLTIQHSSTPELSACESSDVGAADYCKPKDRQDRESATALANPLVANCPLLPKQMLSLLRAPVLVSGGEISLPISQIQPLPDLAAPAAAYIHPIQPVARGSTYLRLCVLLI